MRIQCINIEFMYYVSGNLDAVCPLYTFEEYFIDEMLIT